jgi:hypothetical protein
MSRIYKMTEVATENGMDWDQAIYQNEIETVKEFDTLEQALAYCENELGGDTDTYGVE